LLLAYRAGVETVAPKAMSRADYRTQNANVPERQAMPADCWPLRRLTPQPLAPLLGNEESHARYAWSRTGTGGRWAFQRPSSRASRCGLIGSIGVRRDAKAVGALAKLLGDSDAVVACAAARAMGKIGTAEAASALQAALPKASGGVKLDLCEGLFRCAESMAAADQKEQAVAIYE
jgi:hypothetical protein